MIKFEFTEFKYCELSTSDILNEIKNFSEDWQNDFIKYLYSLLFSTNIKVENKVDLQKIVSAYLGYTEGKSVIMEM
jgi:hypothetical protein